MFFESYIKYNIDHIIIVDEEDSAMSTLHHSESKDNIKLRSTSMRLSGSGKLPATGIYIHPQEHLGIIPIPIYYCLTYEFIHIKIYVQ